MGKSRYVVRVLADLPDHEASDVQLLLASRSINVVNYGDTGFLVDVDVVANDQFGAVAAAAAEMHMSGSGRLRVAKLVSIRSM